MIQLNNRNVTIISGIVAIVFIGAAVLYTQSNLLGKLAFWEIGYNKSAKTIAEETTEYLNSNFLAGQGAEATLKEYNHESGVIKISLDIQGESFDVYTTRDGKLLFSEAIPIN